MLMFRNKPMLAIVLNTLTALLLLIFCISQGSAVTGLRCGGKYGTRLVANVLDVVYCTLSQKCANFGKL